MPKLLTITNILSIMRIYWDCPIRGGEKMKEKLKVCKVCGKEMAANAILDAAVKLN